MQWFTRNVVPNRWFLHGRRGPAASRDALSPLLPARFAISTPAPYSVRSMLMTLPSTTVTSIGSAWLLA
jgi:hypothetical protein